MSQTSSTPAVVAPSPEPIPVGALARPALAVLALLMLGVYLVTMDQGAVSQSGMTLHELFHDARHLLGVPCH